MLNESKRKTKTNEINLRMYNIFNRKTVVDLCLCELSEY